jgi:hypothetical protein
MTQQRRTDFPVTRDDVDNALGKVPSHSSPRRRLESGACCNPLITLDHDGIAGRERCRSLLGAKSERMIERVDLGQTRRMVAGA